MILREEIRRLAEDLCHKEWSGGGGPTPSVIESAILEGMKLVLERLYEQRNTVYVQCSKHQGLPWTGWVTTIVPSKTICPNCEPPDRAMTQELLKELE